MSRSPTKDGQEETISGRDLFYWLPGHTVKVGKDVGRLMDPIRPLALAHPRVNNSKQTGCIDDPPAALPV